MSAWSPARMPKIRDQIRRLLTDPGGPIRQMTEVDDFDSPRDAIGTPTRMDGDQLAQMFEQLDRVARHLSVAALYWVTKDMSRLATSAAQTLPDFDQATRPATAGFIVFDASIAEVRHHFQHGYSPVPISAMSWGPSPHGLQVWLYVARWHLEERIAAHDATVRPETPLLMPVGNAIVPYGNTPTPREELTARYREPLLTLAAAWALMEQPQLTDRTLAEVDRKIRRAYGRADRPVPDVSIIDLRRRYVAAMHDPDDDGSHDRQRYVGYRKLVPGFWRNQAWGPNHSLRRRQFIPDFFKGDPDAPLKIGESVHVWRR